MQYRRNEKEKEVQMKENRNETNDKMKQYKKWEREDVRKERYNKEKK